MAAEDEIESQGDGGGGVVDDVLFIIGLYLLFIPIFYYILTEDIGMYLFRKLLNLFRTILPSNKNDDGSNNNKYSKYRSVSLLEMAGKAHSRTRSTRRKQTQTQTQTQTPPTNIQKRNGSGHRNRHRHRNKNRDRNSTAINTNTDENIVMDDYQSDSGSAIDANKVDNAVDADIDQTESKDAAKSASSAKSLTTMNNNNSKSNTKHWLTLQIDIPQLLMWVCFVICCHVCIRWFVLALRFRHKEKYLIMYLEDLFELVLRSILVYVFVFCASSSSSLLSKHETQTMYLMFILFYLLFYTVVFQVSPKNVALDFSAHQNRDNTNTAAIADSNTNHSTNVGENGVAVVDGGSMNGDGGLSAASDVFSMPANTLFVLSHVFVCSFCILVDNMYYEYKQMRLYYNQNKNKAPRVWNWSENNSNTHKHTAVAMATRITQLLGLYLCSSLTFVLFIVIVPIYHTLILYTAAMQYNASIVNIHIHHHYWSFVLLFFIRCPKKSSIVLRALLIAIWIHGSTVFGFENVYMFQDCALWESVMLHDVP